MKLISLLQNALIAGGIAALINVIIYLIAKNTGVLNNNVLLPPGKPLSLIPVIVSSLIPAVMAAFVLFALSKFTVNPIQIFLIVSLLLLAISIIIPLATLKIPFNAKLILCLMHLVAGLIIIFMLKKSVA